MLWKSDASCGAAVLPTSPPIGRVQRLPRPASAGRRGGHAGTRTRVSSRAALLTSVSELTPISSFGGDIVGSSPGRAASSATGLRDHPRRGRRTASRGHDVGNTSPPLRSVSSAVNDPGVIYRVDPATGKANVFFDLNTVISQIDLAATKGNSAGAATGLVNWYDITFDPEGYFDGKPSMFVSSVDLRRPGQERDLPDRPRRHLHGHVRRGLAGHLRTNLTVEPSSNPRPAGPGPVVPRGLLVSGGA